MEASVRSRIAMVRGADSLAIQHLFSEVAADWRVIGQTVVGAIAEPHGLPDRACTAGILRDIVSGRAFSIYLETPPEDTSCHLDAIGVEEASAWVVSQIRTADIVILSKFGKLEATQRGLSSAFEAALAAGKPVLTTVSDTHRAEWQAFAPDAVELPADRTALGIWRQSLQC